MIKLGDTPRQYKNPFSLIYPELPEHVGETAALPAQVGKGEVPHRSVLTEPAHGKAVLPRGADMAGHRLMGDVQALPARKAVELVPDPIPGKFGTTPLVVKQVRPDAP